MFFIYFKKKKKNEENCKRKLTAVSSECRQQFDAFHAFIIDVLVVVLRLNENDAGRLFRAQRVAQIELGRHEAIRNSALLTNNGQMTVGVDRVDIASKNDQSIQKNFFVVVIIKQKLHKK